MSGLNVHYIRATIDDTFKFLACVLFSNKIGNDLLEIEEDDYIIYADYTTVKIMMCLYKMGEDACVI